MSKSSKQSHSNAVFEHFKFIDDNFNFLIGYISESGAKPGDVISCLYTIFLEVAQFRSCVCKS